MKRITVLGLIIALIFSLCACSDSGIESALFEWDTPPKNIDPLLATEQGELTVVKNIFEPLMVANEDGTLSCGAATDYNIDSSGLIYTFTINTKSKWSDGTAVTPNDFLFALKRAVNPKTRATCALSLTSIKNVPEILEGKISVDNLGVSVSNDKLIITLSKKDNNFLRTLSGVAGMPCNPNFFEKSGGKYGMTEETIISNGPFYVTHWNTDQDMESLKLGKNEHYKGKNIPFVSRVRFFYEDSENRFGRMKNNEINCGGMDIDLLRTAENEGITTLKYGMGVTSLIFNSNSSLFKNADLRRALTSCIDTSSASNGLPKYVSPATSIMGENYLSPNGAYTNGKYVPKKEDAKALFNSSTANVDAKDLSKLTLYYVNDNTAKLYASYIAQSWQSTLGLYVTLSPVSLNEGEGLLKSGDFSFIIYPLSSDDKMASQLLSNFTSLSQYSSSIKVSDDFDRLVSLGDSSSLTSAENILYNEHRVIPLYEKFNAYCIGSDVKEYPLFPGSNILNFSKMR